MKFLQILKRWNTGRPKTTRRRPCQRRVIEVLESRWLLATFSLNAGVAPASQDYFAIEQNAPRDFTTDQRVNAGFDDTGLSNVSIANSEYNFTTSNVANEIFLLHPGYTNTMVEPTSGLYTPIDTSKYYILTFKLTADNVPDPTLNPGAAVQGNIQWYNGPVNPQDSATQPFFVFPGTNIYSFDLRSLSLVQNSSGPWTGAITGLRLYPSNQSGITEHLDWVTLSGAAQSSVGVSLTGDASATAQVGVSPDSNPADIMQVIRNSDLTTVSREQLVGPTSPGSLTSVDLTGLESGTYYLFALDSNGNVVSGTAPQQVVVNSTPTMQILTPNAVGNLSTDYASLYKAQNLGQPSQSPDPWNFSSTSTYTVPYTTLPSDYGVPTIVTSTVANPYATQIGGNLPAGNWLRTDNTTATKSPFDTNFLLNLGPSAINATQYTNLTIPILLDRPRDIGAGAIMRVAWANTNPPQIGLTNFNQTGNIIVENGLQYITVDLTTVPIDPLSPGQVRWGTGNETYVDYLRIDPHEYPTPTVSYVGPITLTRNFSTNAQGQFNITWNTADANGGAVTINKIMLDPDRTRGNGNEITIATNVPNTGSYLFNSGSVPGLAAGSYYVLIQFSNGTNTSYRYSTGKLDVAPPPAAAEIVMYRAYNSLAQVHFFTTSQAEFNAIVALNPNVWHDETTGGSPFYVPNTTAPIGGVSAVTDYRMYNPNNGQHYLTTSTGERNFLMVRGWEYEGDEAFVYPSQVTGSTLIYKLYQTLNGEHLYTDSAAENAYILANDNGIWQANTPLGYGFTSATPVVVAAPVTALESASAPASAAAEFSAGDGGQSAASVLPPVLLQNALNLANTVTAAAVPPAALPLGDQAPSPPPVAAPIVGTTWQDADRRVLDALWTNFSQGLLSGGPAVIGD